MGELHEGLRHVALHAALVRHDLGFRAGGREIEVDSDEALSRALFEILDRVLVPGVVRDHELKTGSSLDQLTRLLDRQDAAIVGERMDDDDRVLPRLDDFVEIADAAMPRRDRQRTVGPDGLLAMDEESPR